MFKRIVLAAGFVLFFAGLAFARDWEITTVKEGSPGHGGWPAMALDSDDFPHIAAARDPGHDEDLEYARFDGWQWQYEIPVQVGGFSIGLTNKIVVDQWDIPHIVTDIYNTGYGWSYVTKINDEWVREDFPDDIVIQSLFINLYDIVYVFYKAYNPVSYHFARRENEVWQYDVIDMSEMEGELNDYNVSNVVVDSQNYFHIAYSHSEGGQYYLKHAYFDGVHWNKESILSTSSDRDFNYPQLLLNNDGYPRIVYLDEPSGGDYKIKYAYFDGATWQQAEIYNNPVDSLSISCLSLALDRKGRPCVSFFEEDESQEYYVLKCCYAGRANWKVDIVDPDPISYTYYRDADIKVDTHGNFLIAYYKDDKLMFAKGKLPEVSFYVQHPDESEE